MKFEMNLHLCYAVIPKTHVQKPIRKRIHLETHVEQIFDQVCDPKSNKNVTKIRQIRKMEPSQCDAYIPKP